MNIFYIILTAVILVILYAFSAFFSASETALFSLSPLEIQKLKTEHPRLSPTLNLLFQDQPRMLSTILIGNNLVNFAIGAIQFIFIEKTVPSWGAAIAVPLTTVMLLVLGEITPKRLAIDHAAAVSRFFAPPLLFFCKIFRPFSRLLTFLSDLPIFRKILRPESKVLTDEELLSVVDECVTHGNIDKEEASMVDGVFRLSELMASDQMTPRMEIVGLDVDLPKDQWYEIVRKSNHSYLPVFHRTTDAIDGILNTVRYLLHPAADIRLAIETDILFVPENILLDNLLVEFQSKDKQMAIVLDEFGGTAGLITRSDILELITTPVQDSHDHEEPEMIHLPDDTWEISGKTSLEEINHETDLELSADDSDRISGWLTFHRNGRLPTVGTIVEAQNCRVEILQMHRRKVIRANLRILDKNAPHKDISEITEMFETETGEEDRS